MFDFLNERNKTKLDKKISNPFVPCHHILEKRPKKNQSILYEGNGDMMFAVFTHWDKKAGIGWCRLPDGSVDCFEYWKKS